LSCDIGNWWSSILWSSLNSSIRFWSSSEGSCDRDPISESCNSLHRFWRLQVSYLWFIIPRTIWPNFTPNPGPGSSDHKSHAWRSNWYEFQGRDLNVVVHLSQKCKRLCPHIDGKRRGVPLNLGRNGRELLMERGGGAGFM
jgi:hypothetical protein